MDLIDKATEQSLHDFIESIKGAIRSGQGFVDDPRVIRLSKVTNRNDEFERIHEACELIFAKNVILAGDTTVALRVHLLLGFSIGLKYGAFLRDQEELNRMVGESK